MEALKQKNGLIGRSASCFVRDAERRLIALPRGAWEREIIRYPDDWYEPGMEETGQALELTLKVRDFVLKRLDAVS
jgi:hypothetical protein